MYPSGAFSSSRVIVASFSAASLLRTGSFSVHFPSVLTLIAVAAGFASVVAASGAATTSGFASVVLASGAAVASGFASAVLASGAATLASGSAAVAALASGSFSTIAAGASIFATSSALATWFPAIKAKDNPNNTLTTPTLHLRIEKRCLLSDVLNLLFLIISLLFTNFYFMKIFFAILIFLNTKSY